MLSYYTYTPQPFLKTFSIVTISTYASSGGLILYQAYGNLNAMTVSRKAHLLGDKQIPSVRVFDDVYTWKTFKGNTCDLGSILEETRQDAIWLEDGLKNQDQSVETVSGKLVTPFESHSDDVWKIVTPSGPVIIKEALETLA
ncbi:hypothetical protein Tco_0897772 [Tanacetum coccineum]